MKRTTKIISGLAAISWAALAWVSPTFAWGPERTTYTNNNPADHVVFNSITDNAAIGDERNFVRVRDMSTNETYSDEVKVIPGREYEVYIGYHNNAKSSLNTSGKGIANDVNVASAYPTLVKKGERGMISGIIKTSDGDPKDVWDEAYLTTDESEVTIRYKVGTAKIHNAGKVNGSVLSTNLFTEAGTPIGINVLDGRIPGCAEYSGHITYTLVAEKTSTDLKKQVSLDGENWYEQVKAKPGQTVTYKVTFNNTGNTTLANTIFKDTHDDGLTLVAGTTKVFDVNNTSGKTIPEVLDGSGYNTGDIAGGALVQIIYQAQVSEEKSIVCGKTLNNKILLRYNSEDHGEDDASVVVECDEDRKKPGFEIDKTVSSDGVTWLDNVKIKPDGIAYFNISYKNTGNVVNHEIRIKDALDSANGMEYVDGSLQIWRSVEGGEVGGAIAAIEPGENESLFSDEGIWIGDVRAGETITVRYQVKFTGNYKECEITALYNNASVSGKLGDSSEVTVVYDKVKVEIDRTDENCKKTDCDDHPDAPECNFPKTGPVEIAMAIAIAIGICGGGYYFYRTKKSLKTIEGAATGKDSSQKPDNMVK